MRSGPPLSWGVGNTPRPLPPPVTGGSLVQKDEPPGEMLSVQTRKLCQGVILEECN